MRETLFHLEMLGQLRVRQGSREIHRFRTQKTAALLAYLAFYKQRSHPRDVLIELFWPASPLDAARSNLSVALNALRGQLEEPGIPPGAILITDRSQARLNPDAFTTDAEAFEALLQEADLKTETETRLALQRTALDLYHGDLLPGFYEDWILTERERLRDTYLFALRQVVKSYAETRQYERAIEYAHRVVQADPLRERAYHDIMRLYLAAGRPEDALYQYHALESLLQKELQSTPSAPLRELAGRLRHAAPSHRHSTEARGSETPRSELAPDIRFPVPDSEAPASRVPLRFTRFFGREAELARLAEWLRPVQQEGPAPTPRLITLTGPGGTGKTRLAIEIAWQVGEEFPGGLWFVPLAELIDSAHLGEALREALELPRQTRTPALEQVIAFLINLKQPSLLILDNFEQLTAGGAPVVWTLLNRVPELHCLVTSRQPLSLPGEREVPILPLPMPAVEGPLVPQSLLPAHLLAYSGIALFVDRAQAARPEFQITPRNAEAIVAICQKLEGIPLAIELAAARARALTPAQMLERLTERFELLTSRRADKGERHRSLWAAIDWSYHLLPPNLQRFFARLSVFRGGWSLEAAEVVCEEPAALDTLSQLRGHSLLFAEESSRTLRFRMLETIREFAAEQVTAEERDNAERRHAEYVHQWVMGARLSGQEQQAWYERIEEDLGNVRAALEWSLRAGNEIEPGLQTAGRLSSFWQARGHLSEGRGWYARLLESSGGARTEGRVHALYGAGALASQQGDFEAARSLLEKCLEEAQAWDLPIPLMNSLNELGNIAYHRGDYAQARAHYEQSLALSRVQGSPERMASTLGNLANVAQSCGDSTASLALNGESLSLWREAGNRFGEARTLNNMAHVLHCQGQLAEARACYEQGLEINRELANHLSMSYSLAGLSELAIDQRDDASAAAYARESLALARALNARMKLVDILALLNKLMRAIGEQETVARIDGALERIREEMNYPMEPVEREEYRQVQAELKESLGAGVYHTLRSEGSALSLEEALACLEAKMAARSL